jgi:hypothetical protein
MRPLLLMSVALLLLSDCNYPYQGESRQPVGGLDLAEARAIALMRAADADSGYGDCLIAGLRESTSRAPAAADGDAFLEFAADYAQKACEPEFDRFVAALREQAPRYSIDLSTGTDSEIKDSVHNALVTKMRQILRLSPSRPLPQPGSQQAI